MRRRCPNQRRQSCRMRDDAIGSLVSSQIYASDANVLLPEHTQEARLRHISTKLRGCSIWIRVTLCRVAKKIHCSIIWSREVFHIVPTSTLDLTHLDEAQTKNGMGLE